MVCNVKMCKFAYDFVSMIAIHEKSSFFHMHINKFAKLLHRQDSKSRRFTSTILNAKHSTRFKHSSKSRNNASSLTNSVHTPISHPNRTHHNTLSSPLPYSTKLSYRSSGARSTFPEPSRPQLLASTLRLRHTRCVL
jgi:hypothetical protein